MNSKNDKDKIEREIKVESSIEPTSDQKQKTEEILKVTKGTEVSSEEAPQNAKTNEPAQSVGEPSKEQPQSQEQTGESPQEEVLVEDQQPQQEDQQQNNKDEKNKENPEDENRKRETEQEPQEGQNKKEGEKPDEAKTPEDTKKAQKPSTQKGKSDISPSLKPGELENKGGLNKLSQVPTSKDDIKDKAKQQIEKPAKQAVKKVVKEAVKKAAQAVAKLLAQALEALVASVGWPVLLVVAAICIIVIIIFLLLACAAYGGEFGKTYPQFAGKDDKNVKELITASKSPATGITSGRFHRFDFLNEEDKTFTEEGKIDKRLAAALNYLQKLHKRIAVSHVISTYNKMPKNPEADSQLSNNVSAHKDGLAADVTEIDFVYRTFEPNEACQEGFGDIVYYGDEMGESSANQTASTAELAASAEEIRLDLLANLDMLSKTISEVEQTANENQTNLSAILGDKSGDLTEMQRNAAEAKSNVESLKTKVSATIDKVLEVNQELQNDSNALAGAADQGKAKELQDKIASAQKSLSTVLQKLNSTSDIVKGLNDRLAKDHGSLEEFIQESSQDANGLDTIIKTLNVDMVTIKNLNNVAVVRGLDALTGALTTVLGAISNLRSFLQNNTFGLWDQFSGAFADQLGVVGSLLGAGGSGETELLRLICEGTVLTVTSPDTNINGFAAEAIPIKVSWQDDKPNVTHTDNSNDESQSVDPRVFYSVYRPEARFKVHQAISQLLQFPYDMGNPNEYKITQLITFSEERDVAPFKEILDKLYGKNRRNNIGLFSMPESWAQIHIGY